MTDTDKAVLAVANARAAAPLRIANLSLALAPGQTVVTARSPDVAAPLAPPQAVAVQTTDGVTHWYDRIDLNHNGVPDYEDPEAWGWLAKLALWAVRTFAPHNTIAWRAADATAAALKNGGLP